MTKINPKDHKFGIIRHYNSPMSATLPDGTKVYREEKIFVPEDGKFIACAPYSDHFIFEVPPNLRISSYMCTCGSPAVVAGLSGYIYDASPQGKMFVCLHHATYGYHAHSDNTRWI